MKKTNIFYSIFSLSAIVLIAGAFSFLKFNEVFSKRLRSNLETFCLNLFDLDTSQNESSIFTNGKNEISFFHDNITSLGTESKVFCENGFVSNITKISGLKSISINFITQSALDISYGWFQDDFVINN